MRAFSTYLIGLIFGIGIVISGMGNPAKVLNFFDVAGTWDPSLGFVMGGALIVAAIGYQLAFRRKAPIYQPNFIVPTSNVIDRKLVFGSATFGVGWGLAGFCPGAALPVLGAGDPDVYIFFGAMVAGIFAARGLMKINVNRQIQSTVTNN